MMRSLGLLLALMLAPSHISAEELNHFQTLYDLESVTTRTLSIQLDSVDDDVRFSVTLRNEETGLERRHEFDGQGASDPSPYLLEYKYDCGVDVILLTVEYPWRHALPMYVRVLGTFAFRESDSSSSTWRLGPRRISH